MSNVTLIITKVLANEKAALRLECTVTGLPKPSAKWFFGSGEVANGGNFKLESKGEVYALAIKSLTQDYKGVYRVEAENAVGVTVSKIIVDLNTIPVFGRPLENSEVVLESERQKVDLVCVFRYVVFSVVFILFFGWNFLARLFFFVGTYKF